VKRRLIELMYMWRTQLGTHAKIVEAYAALRRQGIITTDPTYVDGIVEHGAVVDDEVAAPPRLASFEDEEKACLLASLLASNDAADLQAANRLIKSLVRAVRSPRRRRPCRRTGGRRPSAPATRRRTSSSRGRVAR